MGERFRHHFEWDAAKERTNAKKHGITFDRAATLFLDPNARTLFDDEHSDDDERWVTMGLDRWGVLLVVCHTYHEERQNSARVRIISARKATRSEIKRYADL